MLMKTITVSTSFEALNNNLKLIYLLYIVFNEFLIKSNSFCAISETSDSFLNKLLYYLFFSKSYILNSCSFIFSFYLIIALTDISVFSNIISIFVFSEI